jgi:hypothetical protein
MWAPRLRLARVRIPRLKGSGIAGGLVVVDAIAAAKDCAKRRVRVVVVLKYMPYSLQTSCIIATYLSKYVWS